MSRNDDHAVIGRMIMDPEFRSRLLDEPAAAIGAEKLQVSAELIGTLKRLDRVLAEKISGLVSAALTAAQSGEVSDASLDAVTGGAKATNMVVTEEITVELGVAHARTDRR